MPDNDDIELLQQLIRHGGTQAFSLVPAALKNVIEERQWTTRCDKHGKPFASFEAFAAHQLWQGLETSLDDLRVHCRKHPEVYKLLLTELEPGREAGGDHGNQHTGGKRQVDNVNLPTSRGGNSALYTLKRLKRERPDLFQVVLGGGMSPNAAAIKAGFRKALSPLEQAGKALAKLTDIEWQTLKRDEDARRLAELASEAAEDAGTERVMRRARKALSEGREVLIPAEVSDRMARPR